MTAKPMPQKRIHVRVSRSKEVFDPSRATVHRLAKKGALTIHKRDGASWLKVEEVSAYIEGRAA
jgi:hypothetical protein